MRSLGQYYRTSERSRRSHRAASTLSAAVVSLVLFACGTTVAEPENAPQPPPPPLEPKIVGEFVTSQDEAPSDVGAPGADASADSATSPTEAAVSTATEAADAAPAPSRDAGARAP